MNRANQVEEIWNMVQEATPIIVKVNKETLKARLVFYVEHPIVTRFVTACICGNVVIMSMQYGQPSALLLTMLQVLP